MLELRPNCEISDCDLLPDAQNARICTYECTFCASCVDTVLHNVYPNCAGGLVPRPVRPRTARRPGVSLGHQPASTERHHLKYDRDDIAALVEQMRDLPPNER